MNTTAPAVSAVKNALSAQKEPQSIEAMIQKASTELGKALPAHMNSERLVRIALTNIRLNPELSRCTPASFMGALFTAAQIGLEPGVAGRCYLVPFNQSRKVGNEWKSTKEVQFVIGWRGYVELFYRHASGLSLDVQEVCANDFFEYQLGTDASIKHRPATKDRGEVTNVYACAKLKNGGTLFKVMSIDECLSHGKAHSKSWEKGPWAKEPIAMCKKTVILQLAKILPLSIEVSQALSADESSRDYRSGIDSALDLPSTTNWSSDMTEVAPQTTEETPEEGFIGK